MMTNKKKLGGERKETSFHSSEIRVLLPRTLFNLYPLRCCIFNLVVQFIHSLESDNDLTYAGLFFFSPHVKLLLYSQFYN